MKTIWKFPLPIEACVLEMPRGAIILALQTQWIIAPRPYRLEKDERETFPCLWAIVDTEAPKEKRRFETFGTGHLFPDNPGKYIGTFQLLDGRFIGHVFETTGLKEG